MKITWASCEGGVRVAERDDDVGATMDGAMRSRDRLAIEFCALSSRVGAPEVEGAR